MNISDGLTQHKLKELLEYFYTKGYLTENIIIKELIEEIKQQVLSSNVQPNFLDENEKMKF